MRTRTKRKLCLLVAAAGFGVMLGTAAAADSLNVALSDIIRFEALGLTLLVGGFYKGGYLQ